MPSDDSITALEKQFRSSSLKVRTKCLQDCLQSISTDQFTYIQLKQLSLLLFETFNLYEDAHSKQLVQVLLSKILQKEPEIMSYYLDSILSISSRCSASKAHLELHCILEWTLVLLTDLFENDELFEKYVGNLVMAYSLVAQRLDNSLDLHEGTDLVLKLQKKHWKRIRASILQTTTKTLAQSFKQSSESLKKMSILLNHILVAENKDSPSSTGALILISSICRASLQMVSSQPALHDTIKEKYSESVILFLTKEIILGKNAPSIHILELCLKDIAMNLITQSYYIESIVPALEKAIMRSSGWGLSMTYEFHRNLDGKLVNVLSVFTKTKLMPLTFAAFKNNKEEIKEMAVQSTISLLSSLTFGLHDISDLEVLLTEVFKNMKANQNADYKITVSRVLAVIPPKYEGISTNIVSFFAAFIAKEANEEALRYMIDAFLPHYLSFSVNDTNIDILVLNGLRAKKLSIKRIWLVSILSHVNILPHKLFEQFFPDFIAFIVDRSALNNSHATMLASLEFIHASLSLNDCPMKSELMNAISSENLSDKYGKYLVYTGLSRELSSSDRLRATELLENLFQLIPRITGLKVIETVEIFLKEDIPKGLTYSYMPRIVNAITQPITDTTALEEVLIKILIISQYSQFKLKNGWAGLVLHSNSDPALLVEKYGHDIIKSIVMNPELGENSSTMFYTCAMRALAYLCFISPNTFAKLLCEQLDSDMDTTELHKLSSDDIEIWRGEEGVMVFDVLEKLSANKLTNKNTKDYETLKWEESVKRQQARKGHRQLTKEEKEKVDEQLEKESRIRGQVAAVKVSLDRAISIVNHLIDFSALVNNGSESWFPVIVKGILDITRESNSYSLIGYSAIDLFTKASNLTSDRLGSYRFFLGMAILRLHKVSHLPSNLVAEPLDELVSRVMFRLKMLSNQSALDALTLIYMLPLLTVVLREGYKSALRNVDKPLQNSEFVEEDKEEENLLLALEIISAHSSVFSDSTIPRSDILFVLLSLLSLPSKSKAAKECFNALCQSISATPNKSDLNTIISFLISPNLFVRTTILEVLDNEFELESFMSYSPEIFMCRFDVDSANRETASFIWDFNHFEISESLLRSLLALFEQSDSGLRLFIAQAFAYATLFLYKSNPLSLSTNIHLLAQFYLKKAEPPKDVKDEYGLVVIRSSDIEDPWMGRSTAAIALKEITKAIPSDSEVVVELIEFLVQKGALGDKNTLVRQEMKEAGIECCTLHGAQNAEKLIPILDEASASTTESNIKENVIILYGTLARYLAPDDVRIRDIVEKLLKTLDTPSTEVQRAVSSCIADLVFLFKENAGDYILSLMETLFDESSSEIVRKGAAWGLAGLVKGYGIEALSEFDVVRNLIEAAEDKRDPRRRQSVAYAIEYLSLSLGRYFEPYVLEVLQYILKNLGDSVPEVRDATAEATKVVMTQTTSYGVKKLIPIAISNLNDMAWRTKRGSVELLGNMAYLDPAQLSSSLSIIVPEIVSVLNDTHKEVRKAADASLQRFGEVIRNPEIQKLVPVLLRAIGDPTKHTDEALDALIHTQFVHYIDGPSLALIIHIIHRGMLDRSANTKRKACKIVGNMTILVDTKDLVPYLQQLIEEVEIAMVDPVPATRATAARALGALVERLGEEQFPTLIPSLLSTLADESRAGDRLGSAQALAEVISGLGISKLDELLPTILAGVTDYRPYVKAGYMPLLMFLPVCFGSQFAPYINQIIQPILSGLADTDETIREVSLKAGKLVVQNYATKAIDLLLPELERGMFDENERIRLSSVQLSGDLLFQITGISSKTEYDEDTEYSNEASNKLVDVLGQERRNRILAALFVCRNDVSGIVRSSTVDIWKALVPNTPRTIKEILPLLTTLIVSNLASSSSTLRSIAAQTLGDVVRRVGGNAMSHLLPTLQESIEKSSNPESRQGVCIALHELIRSASAESLLEFQDYISTIIRKALVDVDESVRQAGAIAFDVYQETTGKTAVDEIIPYLLHAMESEQVSDVALKGLQDIMTTKSEVIFPILIPSLLAPPIDSFRASALGSLAEVAGPALYKRLSTIINSLVDAYISTGNTKTKETLEQALDKVMISVNDNEGLHPLLQQIMSLLKNEDFQRRVFILERLPNFFENTALDLNLYLSVFVSNAILSLDDHEESYVKALFAALSACLKNVDKSMLLKLVEPAKQSLLMTGIAGTDLAAFKLPSGPSCVLPIFLHGLMYGSNGERESSALGIADIASKTPAANLRPFVSAITGPLIRVVGERVGSDIKAAILFALNVLFVKIPTFLRPFIPQLQRTFIKSLSDTGNETLRIRAAKGLGDLIEYQPRVDPLVAELVTGVKQATDEGVKTAMLRAIVEVVSKAGPKMNEISKSSVVSLIEEQMLEANEKMAITYAKLLGAVSEILKPEEASTIINEKILKYDFEGTTSRFAILALNAFLRDAPSHIFQPYIIDKIVQFIIGAMSARSAYYAENGTIAAGKLLLLQGDMKSPFSKTQSDYQFIIEPETVSLVIAELARSAQSPVSSSNDQKRLALVIIRTLARHKYNEIIAPHLDTLAPAVFAGLRDRIIPIKLASEKAYLAIFKLVDEQGMDSFERWFDRISQGKNEILTPDGTKILTNTISEYTKRVASRLATVERERILDGGDAETMFSDQFEDEREIWAVGGVELNSN